MKFDPPHIYFDKLKETAGLAIVLESKEIDFFYLKDQFGNSLKINKKDLIHNGKGIGIASNQLMINNADWLLADVEQLFFEKMGIVFLYWIPDVPNQKEYGIGSFLKFADEKSLLLDHLGKETIYWEKIKNYLKKQGLRVKEALKS